ncbi:hypothetical protein GCM10009854_15280 [Saccharopolyspora halophila]|uniref:Uncharacterized protein n=1 Tax=Saccharopolyspora halophila TaxID=405551 RepID=A0ABN3FXL2_9PSEU
MAFSAAESVNSTPWAGASVSVVVFGAVMDTPSVSLIRIRREVQPHPDAGYSHGANPGTH